MAINYGTLFGCLGKLTKYINARLATATTTLPAELAAVRGAYPGTLDTLIDGLDTNYASMQGNVTGERVTLSRYFDSTLTDRTTVLSQITVKDVTGGGIGNVLSALPRQMIADGQTVNRSTVTLGLVSAAGTNQGNGTVITSKLLDGYNAPLVGGTALIEYAGVNSELAVPSETMIVECRQDSSRSGLQAGSEVFAWSGGIRGPKLDWQADGSGTGPGLTAAGATTVPTNAGFESFNGNTPNGWTIVTGAAGTNVSKSTGTVYRGSGALQITGDGATATIELTQAVAGGSAMNSRRLYFVSVRVNASAAAGTGALTIQFKGPGYTATSTEKVSVLAGAMPTSWTLYSFAIVTPAVIPTDWKLSIAVSGTPGLGANVWIDDLFVLPGVYHGGIAAAVIPGSAPFAIGDRLSFTVANDAAGVLQDVFRKNYGVQLPSSGAPSISDALAS
jgi:hypothetical protein